MRPVFAVPDAAQSQHGIVGPRTVRWLCSVANQVHVAIGRFRSGRQAESYALLTTAATPVHAHG